MRDIDAAAPVPVAALVDRAGAAVARSAMRLMGGSYGRRVAVLAGPGHNGADGRVAAMRLRERGVSVVVHEVSRMPRVITGVDLVIDAGFGSGFRGAWDPPLVDGARILAVDVPTGLDARTGAAHERTLRADTTVTFAALRPGHLLGQGPEYCGEVVVADIGLVVEGRPPPESMCLVERSDVAAWLPVRPRSAHKWSSAVRVVAGGPGMTGAAHLAAAAAQRSGAGMVVVSSPGMDTAAPVEVVDERVPSLDWDAAVLGGLARFHALVIGPGLGRAEHTGSAVVRTVAGAPVPVVIDGDGLFALARHPTESFAVLADRRFPTVLTPHDGEFALLTGALPGADRIGAVRELADRTGSVVLSKGPTTLVTEPGGPVWFVDRGDQRLATAGTGDVLAGILGAFLAQGVAPLRAAVAAAWVHADAALGAPRHGFVAGDLLGLLPRALTTETHSGPRR